MSRPITPLNRRGLHPVKLSGPPPKMEWLCLSQLVVNDEYQRHLSEKSITLIRHLVENFTWRQVRPAAVTPVGGGLYEILDGQHLAVAAATHGGIDAIPCFIVETASQMERAAAFVGLNQDRVNMTPMQIFHAKVKAGDEEAMAVVEGVAKAGGKVLKYPPPFGRYKIGDAMCCGALIDVARSKGVNGVARVCAIAIAARRAPVSALLVKALRRVLWSGAFDVMPSDVSIALYLLGQDQTALERKVRDEARMLRVTDRQASGVKILSSWIVEGASK